jgi:hypothetical protein
MKPTTRTIKLIPVCLFLLFASSLLIMQGCKASPSGGCAEDPAPAGSIITAPTELGAPSSTGSSCFPALGFLVTDANGEPLNDICVEIFSDASIALHSGLPNCSNVAANPQTSITTKTNDHGQVIVELLTGPTATGATHFVEVVSGSLSAVATTAAAQ